MMLATATKNETKTETNFFAEIIAAIDNAEHTTVAMSPLIVCGNQTDKDSFFETRRVSQCFQPSDSISHKIDANDRSGRGVRSSQRLGNS